MYVNTLLFYRVGGTTRKAGFLLALATFVLLVVGTEPIGYIRTSLSDPHFFCVTNEINLLFVYACPYSYFSHYAGQCAHIRAWNRPRQRGRLGYSKKSEQVRVPHYREHHGLYDTLKLCKWRVREGATGEIYLEASLRSRLYTILGFG